MTVVAFSGNGATSIVLIHEKNHLGFFELYPGNALEAKLCAFLHAFFPAAAACRKLL